jgi:hypothetical protein
MTKANDPTPIDKLADAHPKPASAPVGPTPAGRPQQLLRAHFLPPVTIELTFADGRSFSLPIERLGMPVDRIRWSTAKASPTGEIMVLTGTKGDDVPIESSTLRYLVDQDYAKELEAALGSVRLSREELREMARDNPPPPEVFDEPGRDMTRESWK